MLIRQLQVCLLRLWHLQSRDCLPLKLECLHPTWHVLQESIAVPGQSVRSTTVGYAQTFQDVQEQRRRSVKQQRRSFTRCAISATPMVIVAVAQSSRTSVKQRREPSIRYARSVTPMVIVAVVRFSRTNVSQRLKVFLRYATSVMSTAIVAVAQFTRTSVMQRSGSSIRSAISVMQMEIVVVVQSSRRSEMPRQQCTLSARSVLPPGVPARMGLQRASRHEPRGYSSSGVWKIDFEEWNRRSDIVLDA